MAKVTWLGEDEISAPHPGPSFTVWNGVKFDKGKPVDITDPYALEKAKGNRFFDVEEEKRGPGRPRIIRDGDEDSR